MLVLGCTDRDEAFAIPATIIGGLLPKMNRTDGEAGENRWHVLFTPHGDEGLALYLPKTGEKKDLHPFTFSLGPASNRGQGDPDQ
jgi:hypothetical protein